MNKFLSQFSDYEGCLPAGLLLPEVKIDDKFYRELGLDPKTSSSYDFLLAASLKGIDRLKLKDLPNYKQYEDRLYKELSLFRELNFCDYILLVWDVLNFCRLKEIPTGLGRGCLTGDSPIQTFNRGLVPIKDIRTANSVDESGVRVEPDTIIDKNGARTFASEIFSNEYHGPLVKIIASMASKEVPRFTKDHKILVLEAGKEFLSENLDWKRADEIKRGDFLARAISKRVSNISVIDLADYADKNHIVGESTILEKRNFNNRSGRGLSIKEVRRRTGLSTLAISNYIKYPEKSKPKTKEILDAFFSNNPTIDKEALKVTMLERTYNRYITIDQDFCYMLGYYIGDGWKYSSYFCLIFHDTDNIEEMLKIKKYLSTIVHPDDIHIAHDPEKTCYTISVNCRILTSVLNGLFESGSARKFIPEAYRFLPAANASALLEGLVASDGSVQQETLLTEYTSISRNLVYQVRDLAERLGHVCYIVHRPAKDIHKKASWSVRWNPNPIGHANFGFNNGKHVFIRVKEVVEEPQTSPIHVYDLCVDSDPSFHTSNFIVHNSAAGSLVLYLIGVTGIDPIKHNLYFERFVSKARAKKFVKDGVEYLDGSLMCDIDNDIAYEDRQEVIDYIYSKYPHNTSSIMTLATLSGKLCVKECGKIVDELTEEEADSVAKSIPKVFGKVMGIEEASRKSDKFAKWVDAYPETFKIARALEGLIKNTSVHASGIAISQKPIGELVPLNYTSEGNAIAAYEMDTIAKLMLKVDILGLRTLSVVDKACELIGIDWKEIDVNHPSIYAALQDLRCPKGLFQIEADATWEVCKKIKPANVGELSDVIALSRPGAMAFVGDYLEKKNGTSFVEERHPELDKILSETKGSIIYQEQLLAIANRVFGFSLEDAEILRRIVGKKKKEEMKKWEAKIHKQAEKLGLDLKLAEFFWKALDDSKDYSFNKCIWEEETVELDDGKIVALKDVCIGDRVKGYDCIINEDVFTEVLNVYKNNRELYEVQFSDGKTIRVSMDHEFLCSDMKKRRLSELIDGDFDIVSEV
jgi:intein/homing endonuclease